MGGIVPGGVVHPFKGRVGYNEGVDINWDVISPVSSPVTMLIESQFTCKS